LWRNVELTDDDQNVHIQVINEVWEQIEQVTSQPSTDKGEQTDQLAEAHISKLEKTENDDNSLNPKENIFTILGETSTIVEVVANSQYVDQQVRNFGTETNSLSGAVSEHSDDLWDLQSDRSEEYTDAETLTDHLQKLKIS
jgi:hypothetical protein